MSERDNICRWDGERRGHYEVWYLTANHRESRTGTWIRYTLESPRRGAGEPYAQLWFAFFDAADPARNFALNRRFPIAELRSRAEPFEIVLGSEAVLEHDGARGRIAGGGHEASWDLSWRAAEVTHHHLPALMYRRGGLGDTTVLSPNLDVPVSGTLVCDGRRFELDGEPGGQTHLWGRKHAHAWAWGHCNAFRERPGAVLETLTVQLERAGRALPHLTLLSLYLDGELYRFNRLRDALFGRGSYRTGLYRFEAIGPRLRLEGEYSCRPEDMVLAEYADPDGDPAWCANTEVADLRVTVFERAGPLGRWRERERLLAPRSGHFEVGRREPDPAVEKLHVPV